MATAAVRTIEIRPISPTGHLCIVQLNILTRSLGPGRCFPFWQEVLACYVVNSSPEDRSGAQKCGLALEDYYECLHHKKEVGTEVRAHKSLEGITHAFV